MQGLRTRLEGAPIVGNLITSEHCKCLFAFTEFAIEVTADCKSLATNKLKWKTTIVLEQRGRAC